VKWRFWTSFRKKVYGAPLRNGCGTAVRKVPPRGTVRRENGVTLAEIARATDWQNHSIRPFISGSLTKKMGLNVESTKNEAGERTYRIK
jgi:hypothetical protein